MKTITILDKDILNEIYSFIAVLHNHDIIISKVILFGSHAKGKAHNDSDIDLAIISPSFGKNGIQEAMLLSKLSWKVSDRIESIPLTNTDLKMKYHPLIQEIKKYGTVVYSS